MPMQVIFVTLVLDRILSKREKSERLRKINIVISSFYSEIGTLVLSVMIGLSQNLHELEEKLNIKNDWTSSDFKNAIKFVEGFDFRVECDGDKLFQLNQVLSSRKDYVVSMFGNPTLLEHDTFTDMLWALYHISDELNSREGLMGLPHTDLEHLSNDIVRAYRLLTIEWICYMDHLRIEYPYLYSLALRKNPFCSTCSVIVK